ncbi:MAG TPA: cytochrome c-type biogenesis protein CcmH [Gaiellaceae bacterium]|nr:cytochrome c-type biogenesis protein CcmH [Gaiellaceae bacterium]
MILARLAAVTVAALALAGPAAAACTHPRTSLTFLEGQIMCPTCHTTLDQSDAPAAERIKAYIETRIDQCATAQQIESELVANFGAGILAEPTHKGLDLLAWWLPLGGVILGAGLLGLGVWRWSRAREPAAAPAGSPALNGKPSPELDPETERRLDELLAKLE